ncbi:MAG TPA: HD domain-containing protein [Longimicrobiaceae bacterium]|jgi:2-amino-4-hydroxy-6-hydroxymethyldihydropteridine diphosphokinase|nr:HD domain-containing protein [Longimicrobiaceae bacterium]
MNAVEPASALSETVRAAAAGKMPVWAVAKPKRREHVARVAALMREWAEALGLGADDVARWAAAGTLHDALRDADPDELRREVPPELRGLHDALLHGPAAAERLKDEADEEMLDAIRYHTLGYAGFGRLGRALYLADFMEPGRRFDPEWTASLRAHMPREMDAVLREVVEARVAHVDGETGSVHPLTLAFRDAVTEGAP